MLEVAAIALLCKINWKNALERGRSPYGFMFMTVALWVGFELVGIHVGKGAGSFVEAYVTAVFLGALGGAISYGIVRTCEEGTYAIPQTAFREDEAPPTDVLFRGTTLETKMRFCHRCNAPLPQGSRVCGSCGAVARTISRSSSRTGRAGRRRAVRYRNRSLHRSTWLGR